MPQTNDNAQNGTRRDFIRQSSGALLGASIIGLAKASGADPNSETLKIGLVGCGNRGSGAAREALLADENSQLVALGDVFADQVEAAHAKFTKGSSLKGRVDVPEERRFSGFDAYKGVIAHCDVVVLAATPAFRPKHLRAAIEAGCHVFCEKPIAVDPAGVRHVMESCRMAKEKNVSLVSGLCYRYENSKRDIMTRIHDGQIGDVIAMETKYNTSSLWHKGREEKWSEVEYQIRNWLYFAWLSGDHINEQHIHSLDKIAWAMGDVYPAKATASGGRTVRTEEKYGNIYDHFNTTYEWANGVKGYSSCRQWANSSTDVNDHIMGTKGKATIQQHLIETYDGKRWQHEKAKDDNMYQNEHNALFASIRSGDHINNGEYMCNSTLMAIMARMSAYTGKTITWDEALNSDLDLMPKNLDFGDITIDPIAVPGVTA